jgi:hypothetical protein
MQRHREEDKAGSWGVNLLPAPHAAESLIGVQAAECPFLSHPERTTSLLRP